MFLRKYTPTDCPHLLALFQQTVHTINARDYSPEQLAAWTSGQDLARWNQSLLAHESFVAMVNGSIAGFGDMDQSGYLDRLYVHKDHQGQGIGTALCQALEERVSVCKYTVHASITAKPFFEQQGYTVVEKQQVMRNGVPLTNYRMERHPDSRT